MKKQIKFSDILRYVYHETNAQENFVMEQQLFHQSDATNQQVFYELIQIKKDLDHIQSTPSKQVIENIMDYARLKKNTNIEEEYAS